MSTSSRKGQRGAVAVVVALLMVTLVVAAAVAIDVGRLVYAQRSMQGLVNFATVTAAASRSTDADKLKALATDYVNANKPNSSLVVLDPVPVTVTPTPATATEVAKISVTLGGTLKPVFGKLVGIGEIRIKVIAKADQPQPGPADVVLALDTTASMNARPSDPTETRTKITILRTAATALVNKMMTTTNPNIQFGVVPYASYVNVGLQSPVPDWILKIDRRVTNYCTRYTWEFPDKPCINLAPVDCWIDGVWTIKGCSRQDCSPKGRQICQKTEDITWTWGGCVGARSVLTNNPLNIATNTYTTDFLDKISSPTDPKYSGQSTASVSSCGSQILGLTNDKTTVLSRITGLVASGETHLPSGLIWGWNALAPEEPYVARTTSELEKLGGKKFLVLMTDGINSTNPRLFDGAYLAFGNTSLIAPFNDNGARTNQLTKDICTNIKNDKVNKITIFTVLFDVKDAAVNDMLTKCAEDTGGKSFSAANQTQLLAAFDEIANLMMSLKVTQ